MPKTASRGDGPVSLAPYFIFTAWKCQPLGIQELAKGMDIQSVSELTGIPIEQLKNIRPSH